MPDASYAGVRVGAIRRALLLGAAAWLVASTCVAAEVRTRRPEEPVALLARVPMLHEPLGEEPATATTAVVPPSELLADDDITILRHTADMRAAAPGATSTLDRARLQLDRNALDEGLRIYLPKEDFAEPDPEAPRFAVAGLDADSQRSVVGGQMRWRTYDGDESRLVSESHLLWLYESLQTEGGGGTSGFFSPGDRSVFAVQGLHYGRNWALLGTGFRWELRNGWSAFTHYDAQANSQQVFYLGSGGVNYAW